jgi:hypothetical protein
MLIKRVRHNLAQRVVNAIQDPGKSSGKKIFT